MLSGNPIQHVAALNFSKLVDLRVLEMDDMRIKTLQVGNLFSNLPALR